MGMDLITLEVLRHKFGVIADEMEMARLKSAYSSIVKEGMDASSALFTTDGETMAQAASPWTMTRGSNHTHESVKREGTSGKG